MGECDWPDCPVCVRIQKLEADERWSRQWHLTATLLALAFFGGVCLLGFVLDHLL